ncbi:hypothetical protein FQN60_001503, partial [Etheostoma spectabile]
CCSRTEKRSESQSLRADQATPTGQRCARGAEQVQRCLEVPSVNEQPSVPTGAPRDQLRKAHPHAPSLYILSVKARAPTVAYSSVLPLPQKP